MSLDRSILDGSEQEAVKTHQTFLAAQPQVAVLCLEDLLDGHVEHLQKRVQVRTRSDHLLTHVPTIGDHGDLPRDPVFVQLNPTSQLGNRGAQPLPLPLEPGRYVGLDSLEAGTDVDLWLRHKDQYTRIGEMSIDGEEGGECWVRETGNLPLGDQVALVSAAWQGPLPRRKS